MIATALSHTVEAGLAAPGLEIELHSYRQPKPFQGVFNVEAHTLSMSLTPQVSYSRCCYVDAAGQRGPWVQAGDIMFTPRGTRLMVLAPGGAESYRGIYCAFDSTSFEAATGLGREWSAEQLAASLSVQAPTIKRDLYRIVQELSESGFGRESLIESIARIAMIELARYLRQASVSVLPPLARSALAAWQMRRITDYVEGMIDHCPSVEELARLCKIGPRHLARAFKASTGRTIGQYVTDVRMTKAKSLLADTDLSQKEIAYRLGFSGPSSFCAAFGKAVQLTPRQFRLRHLK